MPAKSLSSGGVLRYMRELHTAASGHKKHSEVAILRRDIARPFEVLA
jgi:hypothetical protein